MHESHYPSPVQRLFSMFPLGAPGFALLLLRTSVAVIFFMSAVNRGGVWSTHPFMAGISVISICLIIGFLTPFLSALVCVIAAVNLLIGTHLGSLSYILQILNAAALALLGPGAYSIDARLFGRRVIIIPPGPGRDQS